MTTKLLKKILACAFCVAMAWFAAKIVFYFFAQPSLPEFYATPRQKKPSVESASTLPVNYETVLKRNLFHVPVEAPLNGLRIANGRAGERSPQTDAEMLAEMGALPISKRGWTLLGTIVNDNLPAQSRAILLVEGKQGAFAPGADIRGWKIAHIARRTVVLDKNGKRERLLVGGNEIAAPPKAQQAVAAKNLSAREIESVMGNIPRLMKEAHFSPGEVNGVYGLNLSFLQPDSFLGKLGLRQNDLLTSANGRALANLGDLAGFTDLASQNFLRLELVRDGKNITLEYEIAR